MGDRCSAFAYVVPFKSRRSFLGCVASNSWTISERIIIFLNKGIPCVMKVDGDSLIGLWAKT